MAYNGYCREVEIALERHPDIDTAAVIGVPDRLYGEVGHAFILRAAGTDPRGGEDPCLCPRAPCELQGPQPITLVEELPLLPVGKVDKQSLRQRATGATA